MSGFDALNENSVGVDGGTMNVAITNLDDIKTQFTNWNNQLVGLRDQVINDWLGGASEQFTASYEALAEAMMRMISCAEGLRNFSQTTVDSYSTGDEAVREEVAAKLNLNGMG